MTSEFPKPDRSDFVPNFAKTPENDILDLGWAEGVLSDGRPYRLEYWCQDQSAFATVFISRRGLEGADTNQLINLLAQEKLVQFSGSTRYVSGTPFTDSTGNDILSITAVIAGEDHLYATIGPSFTPYDRRAASEGDR